MHFEDRRALAKRNARAEAQARRLEMHALVLNAGSSSLKFAVYVNGQHAALTPVLKGAFDRVGLEGTSLTTRDVRSGATLAAAQAVAAGAPADHSRCMAALAEKLAALGIRADCAGHRVVHGGDLFHAPAEIDAAVLKKLEALVPLAPLHQPHNLAGIRALQAVMPGIPQVACFDTAFHHTQPAVHRVYALPREITASGVRAYGFHGLSYEYIAGQPELAAHSRVVVAHLGNGASVCAIRDGASVASSMGFTALDGLPMGTRTGSIDPGVVLHLVRNGMSADGVECLLYKKSGLLGISGSSSDMRDLLASGDPQAAEAIDYFCEKTAQHIARMAVALRGLDALVFTAGIGENAPAVRADICERLAFLGVELGRGRNADDPARKAPFERRVNSGASSVAVYVIPTDEERVIARHARSLLARAIAA
jgi:acetate kinase